MNFTQNELYIIYTGLLERQYKIEIMLNNIIDHKYLVDSYKEEQLHNDELIAKVRTELNYHE